MNKKQKQKYYKEIKKQYDSRLFTLIGLYLLMILTLPTIIIPLLLLIPLYSTHKKRDELRAEMIMYEDV